MWPRPRWTQLTPQIIILKAGRVNIQTNCGFNNDSFRDGSWHCMLTILRVWLLPHWLAPPGLAMQTTTENNRNSCKNNNNNKDVSPFTLQLDFWARCFSPISIGSQLFIFIFVGDNIPHSAGSSYKPERAKEPRTKGPRFVRKTSRATKLAAVTLRVPCQHRLSDLGLLALHWACGHIRYITVLPQTPGGMHGWRTTGFCTQYGFHFTRGHISLFVSASFPL